MSHEHRSEEREDREGSVSIAARNAKAAVIPPSYLGVVVPAHNEQDLIGACVRAIAAAAAAVAVEVRVVVVLDDCTDATLAAVQAAAREIAASAAGDSAACAAGNSAAPAAGNSAASAAGNSVACAAGNNAASAAGNVAAGTDRTRAGRRAQPAGARTVWSRSASLPFADLSVIAVQARSVGAARRAGAAHLLASPRAGDAWLATTDADSVVPADWFQRQLEHRAAGADAVVGTVTVCDWSEHPPSVPRLYLEHYHPVDGHRHVHGANLSLSADTYLAVGGFSALASDEDVILVDAVLAAERRVTWAADLPVTTSARRAGRAPAGFAAHLSELGQLRAGGHNLRSVPRSPIDRSSAESVA